jgi:uncharacterized lipoprotein YajG
MIIFAPWCLICNRRFELNKGKILQMAILLILVSLILQVGCIRIAEKPSTPAVTPETPTATITPTTPTAPAT